MNTIPGEYDRTIHIYLDDFVYPIGMANLTALTQAEESVTEYWFCRTTSICIEHSQFKIVGNLQENPCDI
ncbi:MAG: hypothetical protein K2H96_02735 [Muribaculaceae bacterium]|nr:hypothetical protein [Muribaculaceae bacterium]